MSSQPPYGYPGGPQGYQQGGYPPQNPPPTGQTKVLNLNYNTAALLCYIPTCCCLINLVPCILWLASEPRENRFLRFHSLQGLFLAGVWIVLYVIYFFLAIALGVSASMMPGASMARAGGGFLFLLFRLVVLVVMLAIHITAMVKANSGQMWKLPIIGDLAEKNA